MTATPDPTVERVLARARSRVRAKRRSTNAGPLVVVGVAFAVGVVLAKLIEP